MADLPVSNAPLGLTDNPAFRATPVQKAGLAVFALALLGALVALASDVAQRFPLATFSAVFGLSVGGALLYVLDGYRKESAGGLNDGAMFSSNQTRGLVGWMVGILLTGGYVLLYWYPQSLAGLVAAVDPLSRLLRGLPATLDNGGQWFLYGTVYTLAVLVMGVRALLKYHHSRYQVLRTLSVMGFQLVAAYLLPQLLVLFQQPEFYFSYFWPLKYDYLWPSTISYLTESGGRLGVFLVFWGVVMSFVATPVLTYFYGKRWYCSWVCGCGGLAETAGDPYRHLSDKSVAAWKIERWTVHGVLVFVVLTTALLWINSATEGAVFGTASGAFAKTYGFAIGLVFSGVVGVGLYPLMGARVWCRFGCPMAAVLGLQQRFFSRFRISTNGGQCISCGQCSAHCEMGIDVRWYAQRGQNVVRASCVGCGICATVCPRGVLRLENGSTEGRFGTPHLSAPIADLDIL